MNTTAAVNLWGRTIGAVTLPEGELVATFEYDPAFARSGIQVAPIMMPLSKTIYSFADLDRAAFKGLPGLLADALPDKFGNALINAWLASRGRAPGEFNAIERLCYVGSRGMGALEFAPAQGPEESASHAIEIEALVELASTVLRQREGIEHSFETSEIADSLVDILRVGTSAGGARAKAVIAWNPATQEIRSGQVQASEGFEYWLLKFDGVDENSDRELNDPQGFGAVEYAYYKMAIAAGINMSECRLLEENGRRHFMTRRFDRVRVPGDPSAASSREKIHMQSLCALAHLDFNLAGAHSYEQALWVMRQLGLPMDALEQQFRRMVFNLLARNQDDHTKNIAFLMDRDGVWTLAPAFDITYSFNPQGAWTSQHQMTVNRKRDHFTLHDLEECAKAGFLKRGRAAAIYNEVRETVAQWPDFAREVGVRKKDRSAIERTLRLQLADD